MTLLDLVAMTAIEPLIRDMEAALLNTARTGVAPPSFWMDKQYNEALRRLRRVLPPHDEHT